MKPTHLTDSNNTGHNNPSQNPRFSTEEMKGIPNRTGKKLAKEIKPKKEPQQRLRRARMDK